MELTTSSAMFKFRREVILPKPLAADHLTIVSLSDKLHKRNSMTSSKLSIFTSLKYSSSFYCYSG